MVNEKAVRIAAKLYECRDTVRRLWGTDYPTKIKAWGETIEAIAANKGLDPLEAGRQLASASHDGATQMVILAATVELIEPSTGDEFPEAR